MPRRSVSCRAAASPAPTKRGDAKKNMHQPREAAEHGGMAQAYKEKGSASHLHSRYSRHSFSSASGS